MRVIVLSTDRLTSAQRANFDLEALVEAADGALPTQTQLSLDNLKPDHIKSLQILVGDIMVDLLSLHVAFAELS
jgi:hypothetical protein